MYWAKWMPGKRSVLLKYLLSYIAILFMSTFVFSLLYWQIEDVLDKNNNQYNISLVTQLMQIVDSRLKEVDKLSLQISQDSKLHYFLRLRDYPQTNLRYEYYDYIQELKKYRSLSTFVSDFYIYFNDTNIIVTPDMKVDAPYYYEHVFNYPDLSLEQWHDKLSDQIWDKVYLRTMPVKNGEAAKRYITYLQSLPMGEQKNANACLAILVDVNSIQSLVKNYEFINQGIVYFFDSNNNLILETGNMGYVPKGTEIPNNDGYFEISEAGKPYQVFHCYSAITGWKYVSVVPRQISMARVQNIRNLSVIVMIIFILVGIITAILLANSNYKPLRKLVNKLGSSLEDKSSSDGRKINEYNLLEKVFKGIKENEARLKVTIDRQYPIVRANYLSRLIQGYLPVTGKDEKTLEFMDIHFRWNNFAIILISIDDCSSFVNDDSESELAQVRFIINNIMDEIINSTFSGYITELDSDRLAVIANLDADDQEKAIGVLYDACSKFIEFLKSQFKINTTLSLSNIYDNYGNIRTAYNEAVRTLEVARVNCPGSVLMYRNINTVSNSFYYPYEIEIQLANLVRNGDIRELDNLIDSIYLINFKEGGIKPLYTKCLLQSMIATIIRISASSTVQLKKNTDISDKLEQLLLQDYPAEYVFKEIKEIYGILCKLTTSNRNDYHSTLFENIRGYAEKNFADPMFSLNMIAGHFDVSPQYLSSFFKKYEGRNLNNFITSLRIGMAKELLLDRSLTLDYIAQKVGYSNDAVFIRIFKKSEGITPGKYRDNNTVAV